MGKSPWVDQRKNEVYYKKAKDEGYRARSAYKLKQLQKKFKIIKRGDTVVDLGAAPGGWLQVAAELVGKKGRVLGIDKEPISPFDSSNIITLQRDMRSPQINDELIDLTGRQRADVVISDLAGNVSGNWSLDSDRQIYLATIALDSCTRILKPGGIFLTKIFRGSTIQEFDKEVKEKFESFKRYRPPATRKSSAEEYYVCFGFKGGDDETA